MHDGFMHASVPSVKMRVVNERLLAPCYPLRYSTTISQNTRTNKAYNEGSRTQYSHSRQSHYIHSTYLTPISPKPAKTPQPSAHQTSSPTHHPHSPNPSILTPHHSTQPTFHQCRQCPPPPVHQTTATKPIIPDIAHRLHDPNLLFAKAHTPEPSPTLSRG